MNSLSLYIFRMTEEKETKSKEGMLVMGLTSIRIFSSLINAGLLKSLFTYIQYYILFFVFFVYS